MSSEVIDDFLPAPDQLLKNEENVKITISLIRSNIDFFKESAKKACVPYQVMIKTVLDRYSADFRGRK